MIDTMAVYNAALCYEKADLTDLAIERYLDCAAIDYQVPNVFLFVSTLYRNTGKDEAALKILQDARVDYPREQSLIIEELNIYLTNKDFERAKTNLELAAKQDSTNEILWFSLGSVLDNIGMTEDAIVAYKKAIDVKSDYFDANYNLGALYFNKAVYGINEANELWKPRMSRTEASVQKKLEDDSKEMFSTAKPFLESAFVADNKDVETIRSLKDIYARTGEDDKFLEMSNLLNGGQLSPNFIEKYMPAAFALAGDKEEDALMPQLPNGNSIEAEEENESTEISAPPSLIVDNIVFKDSNSNNLLEADEQATISFNIKNIGKGSAHGINIQIKDNNNTQGLTYDRSKQINILKPESDNIITIQIDASMELATDTSSFKITISEGNGFDIDPIEISFSTQSFTPPNIEIVDYVFISDVGQMKLGKKVNLQFAVQNLGQGVAEDINISLFIPDNVYATDETIFSINKLNPGEKYICDFSFFTNKRFSNEMLNITANISEKYDKYAIDKTMSVKMEEDISNAIALKVESSVTIENITIDRFSLTSHVDKNIPSNNIVNNRFALVIGNEDYKSKQITLSSEQNVDYAINDATIFKKYCLNTLGVKEENMHFLINATSGQMSQEIDLISKILSKVGNEAELIVYYAGHGYPDESTKVPYLIPVDVSASNLSSAIELDGLYQKLGNTNASKITIFLDACFTGGGRNSGLVASRGVKVKPKQGSLNGNIVVFSASSGDQSSLPYHDEGHGMFTYHLLKKLQETQGDVCMGELSDYLNNNVSLQSLKENKKEQDPTVNTSQKVINDWKNWKF